MKQQKNPLENRRGEVFAKQMILGYLRKTVTLTEINRPLRIKVDEKTMAIKKENG